ncbi:NorM family multidrug efflux MATE transporter [Metapseudomonas otitidis]|uniref:Multidrug-efflux transporter n=1 Tax=Metapseudomonas otitidis TaxID=319939 RepID=A0A1I0SHD0_9GAMM|nr:NorM family multidrug efflux MATE transporter [Pseudomonas otitidis]MDH0334619.1 NorM family multidrug efflux MATE transporter [Pseudomonas otitidis]MDH1105785.1 NorM family multidrug efflux MATE transporter [Pseudomonas otitidis]MDH1158005.1 NorM family multidrug efflux MATE transporter [Pseudomonas otitidis]MDH1166147.1 NorM family multidrug efflux MATE transporter [Pseudomonas otitidis]MEE1891572.1 NorM family multidrug efflux MATE transporter [Pseudomonas otitidis]
MPASLRPELLAILRLAGPLIAAQLANVLMVFTDTVMMGLLGPAELAAGGLGAASYSFVSIFCVGVIAAVGNLVAIRHGAGDVAGAARLTQAGMWLGWGLALAAGLLLWNLAPLLRVFGQEAHNIEGAMQFLSTLVFALPGYMTFMALRGFTSAIGRPGPVMAISIGGALANFALNYVLIHGWFGLPRLGLAGIGLITALVMTAMALLLAWHVTRHPAYAAYSLRHGLLQPRLDDLRELLRLGLPIGGTYAVESGLFAFAALCMGALGSQALAAHQVAIMSVYVAFMVPVGISYAVTFRIGQHFGAGRLEDARRAGRLGIGLGAGCMLSFAALFWLAPEWVVGLFLERGNAEFEAVVQMAVGLLAIAAWFELFDGIQTIAMGAIRGLKDAKTTFLVGLGCYWLVGAPAAWLLAFHFGWGPQGVWWGLASGLACAALGLTLGFEFKTRRLLRVEPAVAARASVAA